MRLLDRKFCVPDFPLTRSHGRPPTARPPARSPCQMPNTAPKVWFSGHSDGSQIAQLAALKYAATVASPERVGGVVLFGPSRVGSRGFAAFYNTLLGGKTAYYYYGRDPASTKDYLVSDVSHLIAPFCLFPASTCHERGTAPPAPAPRAPRPVPARSTSLRRARCPSTTRTAHRPASYRRPQGLWFPGVGLAACPVSGSAYEKLVAIPIDGDGANKCSELKEQSTFLSRWAPDAQGGGGAGALWCARAVVFGRPPCRAAAHGAPRPPTRHTPSPALPTHTHPHLTACPVPPPSACGCPTSSLTPAAP